MTTSRGYSALAQALLFLAAINCAGQIVAQTPPASLTPDAMKSVLADAYKRDTLAFLPGYHIKASFETFTADGQPDGDGISEWFSGPIGFAKASTTFRGHTSTMYFAQGKTRYVDDGFDGSILTYFAGSFLMNPLLPEGGFIQRDIKTSTRQQGSDLLDCAAMQLFGVSRGSNLPTPPPDLYCISRTTHDLALRVTQHFTVSYKDSAPFLDRSIPRLISASQDGVVRIRVRIVQVDQQPLNDADRTAPPNASTVSTAPNIITTSREETTPLQGDRPLPFHRKNPSPSPFLILISREGKVVDVMPMETLPHELTEAAITTLRQRTYAPIVRGGQPVNVITTAYINL
jgi:hypothetical protein